jgi:hypothetical protein
LNVCADFASQLQERLQELDGSADVSSLVHELLSSKKTAGAAGGGGGTPGSSGQPPVPKGPNSRPSSREVPKARNPLAPLPSDTHNRRPSSRQRDVETPTLGSYRTPTPGSYRKVPPAPSSEGADDQKRPLSRGQRRRVEARRKRESAGGIPFGDSPTWSVRSEQSRESPRIAYAGRRFLLPYAPIRCLLGQQTKRLTHRFLLPLSIRPAIAACVCYVRAWRRPGGRDTCAVISAAPVKTASQIAAVAGAGSTHGQEEDCPCRPGHRRQNHHSRGLSARAWNSLKRPGRSKHE